MKWVACLLPARRLPARRLTSLLGSWAPPCRAPGCVVIVASLSGTPSVASRPAACGGVHAARRPTTMPSSTCVGRTGTHRLPPRPAISPAGQSACPPECAAAPRPPGCASGCSVGSSVRLGGRRARTCLVGPRVSRRVAIAFAQAIRSADHDAAFHFRGAQRIRQVRADEPDQPRTLRHGGAGWPRDALGRAQGEGMETRSLLWSECGRPWIYIRLHSPCSRTLWSCCPRTRLLVLALCRRLTRVSSPAWQQRPPHIPTLCSLPLDCDRWSISPRVFRALWLVAASAKLWSSSARACASGSGSGTQPTTGCPTRTTAVTWSRLAAS